MNLSLPIEPPTPPSTCDLYHGDCLQITPTLNLAAIMMSFNDWPYGITSAEWDKKPAVHSLWTQLRRCRQGANHIFSATQPFATDIINSNRKHFRYDMTWLRVKPSRFLLAKKMPMRKHESVLVFYAKHTKYNSQKVHGRVRADGSQPKPSVFVPNDRKYYSPGPRHMAHPSTALTFDESDIVRTNVARLHPTQKPVALIEWLIKSYTDEGDTVLDVMMGSGTTGVACARLGRNFIGIEKDANYFNVASKRIADERTRLALSN